VGSFVALAEIPVLTVRIRNKEDVLVRGLKGYEEYRHRVRYRLLPFLW
jgi:protein-S-isoprenylcysteine O-methyltransferase Ste14